MKPALEFQKCSMILVSLNDLADFQMLGDDLPVVGSGQGEAPYALFDYYGIFWILMESLRIRLEPVGLSILLEDSY